MSNLITLHDVRNGSPILIDANLIGTVSRHEAETMPSGVETPERTVVLVGRTHQSVLVGRTHQSAYSVRETVEEIGQMVNDLQKTSDDASSDIRDALAEIVRIADGYGVTVPPRAATVWEQTLCTARRLLS